MSIPSEIRSLIERLNQEIDEIEQEATGGLTILRQVMALFPENVILIQYFTYLNAIQLFTDISRRQIQTTIETISPDNVPVEVIQESGEDLGTLLGRIVEAKLRVSQISKFLEELP